MRVGICHTAKIYIPLEAVFERLGVDYVIPPLYNQRSLSLGTKHSPEGLCLPFKLTLGSMIEAAELGADTLLMASGSGICRLGYYAKTQKQILHNLGYNVEILNLGVSENKLFGILQLFRHLSNNAPWSKVVPAFLFGIVKLNVIDRIEREVQKTRATELVKGKANLIFAKALTAVEQTDTYTSLKRLEKDFTNQLNQIPRDTEHKPLIVGIIGEFYVVLEPFSNFDVENELGKLGVEVRRRLFLSDWTKFSFFLNCLGINEVSQIHKAALPYLRRDVGGDGWESVGEKVLHSKEWDGIIHLAPFTCMPEIVAQNIMLKTKESIPVLTILCDEQITKTGILTRLEAFVDLLERRRRARNNITERVTA